MTTGSTRSGRPLSDALAASVLGYQVALHELTVQAQAADIVSMSCTFCATIRAAGSGTSVDVTAVDYPGRERRFDVVYHLLSPTLNARIRVHDRNRRDHPGALDHRRLSRRRLVRARGYDLYGVIFTGHPDMRRLLTDYGFDGHPLRKDFPLTGFVEVRYDDEEKRVVYEPVRLDAGIPQLRFPLAVGRADYRLPGDEKAGKIGEGGQEA